MRTIIFLAFAAALSLSAAAPKVGHPSFLSPHSRPITEQGGRVFVANTPADTLDIIDVKTRRVLQRIDVGVDPVCVAIRPDGKEIWVANHVSDSVSVIDGDPKSPTYLQVIATIQDINPDTKATRFDEPVGIAFANNQKAYVALSSENKIAVIDVASRKITKRLNITAQDPRAITVRGERLYVIPFESNNKTQLSGGAKDKIDGDLVTFDAWEHSIRVNNVLSVGHTTDIVKHPHVPDRDLYVFDTRTHHCTWPPSPGIWRSCKSCSAEGLPPPRETATSRRPPTSCPRNGTKTPQTSIVRSEPPPAGNLIWSTSGRFVPASRSSCKSTPRKTDRAIVAPPDTSHPTTENTL